MYLRWEVIQVMPKHFYICLLYITHFSILVHSWWQTEYHTKYSCRKFYHSGKHRECSSPEWCWNWYLNNKVWRLKHITFVLKAGCRQNWKYSSYCAKPTSDPQNSCHFSCGKVTSCSQTSSVWALFIWTPSVW